MATKAVDETTKFNIYSSFTLSSDDVAVLSLLYAPLMGSDALMLYLGFSSLLERNNLKSEEIMHLDFFDIFSLTPLSFTKARIKLEGIGLLITYETKSKSYIYVLCPPLTAKNFIKDATLGLYLYSKVSRETFEYISNHFKIEKIDKANSTNITKSFDEVYSSQIDNEITYDKFKYLLGRKPNSGIKISDYKFDFELFVKGINPDFLDTGISQTFQKQICNLAFVYGFDENEMVGLYQDSINKKGNFDYRLLKNKANILFVYKRNMKAPKLVSKEEISVQNQDLVAYLENTPVDTLLEDIIPGYPEKYLQTVNDIYAGIELPRGVLNCMILKVLKDKGGELPNLNYFKRVSESWVKEKIFSTEDAIRYVTTSESPMSEQKIVLSDEMIKEINKGWIKP